MPDALTPMSGTQPQAFLSSQKYGNDKIAQNMFSPPVHKDKKVMVQPTVLKGVSIQKLWDGVFADGTDFLQRYHDRRKETNLNVGAWEYAADKGSGSRFVSLVTLIDVPRANTPTPLNEAHRFVYCTTDDGKLQLTYQISSQTPSVPAGGSFRTEALCEITADSPTADCSISFWGNCKKMSLAFAAIQYIATPRALKEMTAAYVLMVNMMQEDLCGGAPAAAPAEAPAPAPEPEIKDANASTASLGKEMGGGGDDAAAPSSVFQGVLLVLAFLMSIALVRSMIVVNRAAGESMLVAQTVELMRGAGAVAGTGAARGRDSATFQPLTEEQALMNAAREAQVQTLRYRWLEQRTALSDLQATLSTMRMMMYLQWAVLIGVSVKVFFF